MSNNILLESADDVAVVWANWHQDIMLILDEGLEAATNDVNTGSASGDPVVVQRAMETVIDLIKEKPINTQYYINQDVMNRTRDLVNGITEEPVADDCDCFGCTLRRMAEKAQELREQP